MKGKGVKVTKFIKDFSLEVLHEGADMQEAMLTVSDLNRPGLQSYLAVEYTEHRMSRKTKAMIYRAGKAGPLLGGPAQVL